MFNLPCDARFVSFCLLVFFMGCNSKPREPATVASAAPDRYADGKLLTLNQSQWKQRWGQAQPLPDCGELLTSPVDSNVCKNAQSAIEALKAAVAGSADTAMVLGDAKALALSAQDASEKLEAELTKRRHEPIEAVKAVGKSDDASVVRDAQRGKVLVAPQVKGPAADGHGHTAGTTVLEQREIALAYAGASRMAVKYLGVYLSYAPLKIRKQTLPLVVDLSKHSNWPALRAILREALAFEADPEQKAALQKLLPPVRRDPVPASPGLSASSDSPAQQ